MLKKPKIILFDWDNTLVDSWPAIYEALTKTLVQMGHEVWSEEEALIKSARSLKEYFPEVFGDEWEKAMKIFYSSFENVFLSNVKELHSSELLLKYLKKNNIKMSVISNKKGHYLRAESDKLGWTKYFRNLIGAGDALKDKPDMAIVKMALSGTGVSANKDDVWIVGDNYIDMECANNADCTGILIESTEIGDKILEPYKIAKKFKTCLALKEFMEKNIS